MGLSLASAERTPPTSHLVHDGDWIREHGNRASSTRDLCASCHNGSTATGKPSLYAATNHSTSQRANSSRVLSKSSSNRSYSPWNRGEATRKSAVARLQDRNNRDGSDTDHLRDLPIDAIVIADVIAALWLACIETLLGDPRTGIDRSAQSGAVLTGSCAADGSFLTLERDSSTASGGQDLGEFGNPSEYTLKIA